jgi:hypothetical protein
MKRPPAECLSFQQPGYIITYSELERVERSSDIRHPIVRAALELVGSGDRI